jgi:hypothetical protein
MNINPKLRKYARDILTGDDIKIDQGMQLARELETFLMDAGLGLQSALVYFMEKPDQPKALRIFLYRIEE